VFAYWRTGLSGPVIVHQAGTAVNYFGTGLMIPFEIIYLHELRGFLGLLIYGEGRIGRRMMLFSTCMVALPVVRDPVRSHARRRPADRGMVHRRHLRLVLEWLAGGAARDHRNEASGVHERLELQRAVDQPNEAERGLNRSPSV
jgi:hypothetical protein